MRYCPRILLSVVFLRILPSLPLAAQAPVDEAAQKLEAFATQGWTTHIVTLRSHVDEIKSKVDARHYQLLLAAEYRNLFVCWLMCDGPDPVIRMPIYRKRLLHFAKQAYRMIIKDVEVADDPLRVLSTANEETLENLKRMQVELVSEKVEIAQLASPKAYQAAVSRFRRDMDVK